MNIIKTKKHPILLLLTVAFVMLNSCAEKTDWHAHRLNGKVKSYIENTYEPVEKSGKWQKGELTKFGNYGFSYTEKGYCNRIDFFDENNQVREYLIQKRENGKVIEESRYNAEGDLQGINKYTNISDTKIEFISYELYKEEFIEIAKGTAYLENGKAIRSDFKTLYEGEVDYEVQKKFFYDENELVNRIVKSFPIGDDEIEKFEYIEFDDQNNWTKRLYYEDEESKTPKNIVIRSYEYYE